MKFTASLLVLGTIASTNAYLQHPYCSSFTEDEVWPAETQLACDRAGGKLFGNVCTLDSKAKVDKFVGACFALDKGTCFGQLGNESPMPVPDCRFSSGKA